MELFELYQKASAEKILKTGKVWMLVGVLVVALFTYNDIVNMDLGNLWYFRAITLITLLSFWVSTFFIKTYKFVLYHFSAALLSVLLMMIGMAVVIFTDSGYTNIDKMAITMGNVTAWLLVANIILGVRHIVFPFSIVILGAFIILMIFKGNISQQDLGYIITICTTGALALVTMHLQGKSNFKKFQYTSEIEANEKELLKKTKELEKVNSELKSFNFSISHDLKTPLRAANSFSQLISRDIKHQNYENLSKYTDFITGSVSKMNQLLEDLLHFSNIGSKEMSLKEVNMRDMVNSAWKDLSYVYGKMPKLSVKKLPNAVADAGLLEQVVTNLLSNAVKYSSLNPNAHVEVGAYMVVGETVYYVKDNGAGFDMEFKDSLFDVFKRLHTDREYEGTGVGLAIVKRIITSHEGRVWAKGKEGEGATFYFSLPNRDVKDFSLQAN